MCDNIVGMNTNIMKEEHENKKNSQSLNCLEAFKIRKRQRLCHTIASRMMWYRGTEYRVLCHSNIILTYCPELLEIYRKGMLLINHK